MVTKSGSRFAVQVNVGTTDVALRGERDQGERERFND